MGSIPEVLDMIVADMEQDVKDFEGKPFTGKTLGELHGNLCAAVQALAKIMKKHLEEPESKPNTKEKL
jgi:hypothetical protein